MSYTYPFTLWLFEFLHVGRERRSEAVKFLVTFVKFLVGKKRLSEHLDKIGI